MRINDKIINDFEKLQEQLPAVLDAFGISKTYCAHAAGLTRATFYRKIKNKSFTVNELRKIARAIN